MNGFNRTFERSTTNVVVLIIGMRLYLAQNNFTLGFGSPPSLVNANISTILSKL